MKDSIHVKVMTYIQGGDGRSRPTTSPALLSVSEISSVVYVGYNAEIAESITEVVMKNGNEFMVVGHLVGRLSACQWVRRDHKWETNCGHSSIVFDPTEIDFCPFCGRHLEVLR